MAPDAPVEGAETPKALTPEQQVQEKTQALLVACTQAAMAESRLLEVRGDRTAAPEAISDAAMAFRRDRAAVDAAVTDLLTLQVKLFAEVAQAAVT